MSQITIEVLMEQAQVYASAWSLVGGVFDTGDQLAVAEEEKSQLEEMLEQFEGQIDKNAAAGQVQEIAEGLIAWHGQRIKNIDLILQAPKDTEIRLGSGDNPVIMSGERLSGFRAALIIVKDWLEPFPLSINRTGPSDDLDEDE